MYMSRITLSPAAGIADLGLIAAGDAYADHRLLWSFFPDDTPRREFLFRRMERRGRPSFLVMSGTEPTSPSPAWIVESKPYEPEFRSGDCLGFSLRVNPVVRRRTESGRQVRHDVVMDEKRRLRDENTPAARTVAELVEEAGLAWLDARAGRLGFAPEPGRVACHGYRQHRIMRRGRKISFSSLDYKGVLRVIEPERFIGVLYHGVGPSKAFGCGLLLVKRV